MNFKLFTKQIKIFKSLFLPNNKQVKKCIKKYSKIEEERIEIQNFINQYKITEEEIKLAEKINEETTKSFFQSLQYVYFLRGG